MLQYDVNPALAAAQSISILHKTFGFMTLAMYGRPCHRTQQIPPTIVEKVSGLIYRMQ